MKKIFLLLFLLAFLATGCSLKIIDSASDLFSPPKVVFVETNGCVYYNNGKYKWHGEKGYYTGKFVNEIPQGLFRWYDSDELIREKGVFKNGKREGIFESFNKEGFVILRSVYKNGVKIKG